MVQVKCIQTPPGVMAAFRPNSAVLLLLIHCLLLLPLVVGVLCVFPVLLFSLLVFF